MKSLDLWTKSIKEVASIKGSNTEIDPWNYHHKDKCHIKPGDNPPPPPPPSTPVPGLYTMKDNCPLIY